MNEYICSNILSKILDWNFSWFFSSGRPQTQINLQTWTHLTLSELLALIIYSDTLTFFMISKLMLTKWTHNPRIYCLSKDRTWIPDTLLKQNRHPFTYFLKNTRDLNRLKPQTYNYKLRHLVRVTKERISGKSSIWIPGGLCPNNCCYGFPPPPFLPSSLTPKPPSSP